MAVASLAVLATEHRYQLVTTECRAFRAAAVRGAWRLIDDCGTVGGVADIPGEFRQG